MLKGRMLPLNTAGRRDDRSAWPHWPATSSNFEYEAAEGRKALAGKIADGVLSFPGDEEPVARKLAVSESPSAIGRRGVMRRMSIVGARLSPSKVKRSLRRLRRL
jgi:hypothetical protein